MADKSSDTEEIHAVAAWLPSQQERLMHIGKTKHPTRNTIHTTIPSYKNAPRELQNVNIVNDHLSPCLDQREILEALRVDHIAGIKNLTVEGQPAPTCIRGG